MTYTFVQLREAVERTKAMMGVYTEDGPADDWTGEVRHLDTLTALLDLTDLWDALPTYPPNGVAAKVVSSRSTEEVREVVADALERMGAL